MLHLFTKKEAASNYRSSRLSKRNIQIKSLLSVFKACNDYIEL